MNNGEGLNQRTSMYNNGHNMDNNMGIGLGRGEGEAGQRWGKREKVGTTIIAYNKNKIKK